MKDMIKFLQDRGNRLKLKLLGDLDALDSHHFLVFFNKESLVILIGDNILHMYVEEHGDKKCVKFGLTQDSIPVINEDTNESFNITNKLVSSDLDKVEFGFYSYKSMEFSEIRLNGLLYDKVSFITDTTTDAETHMFVYLKYTCNGMNYAGGGFDIYAKDGKFICLKTHGFTGITFSNRGDADD